jgi:hypothetical protein
MSSSLNRRKDQRSEEVFGHNIKDYTEREHVWSIALRTDFNERGLTCEVHDHGVDGTGELITDKLANYNADKKYAFEGGKEMLIEVKTAPEWLTKFFTFKVFCLKECVAEDAWVCVPRMASYYLFEKPALQKMLKFKHAIYRGFSPNDLAVRIPMEKINKMVDDKIAHHHSWMPKAKKHVEKNRVTLTREKKK